MSQHWFLHDSYANSELWVSTFSGYDFGSGSVLSLRSGEPEADGTGDRKTVRCPSIGSCMILMQTLSSGDPLSFVSPISDLDL